MSEIIVTENAGPPALPIAQVLQTIVRAAENPAVDVAKMRELLGLQKELMAMQAEQQFNAAYHAMRRLLPRIKKNGVVMYKDKETDANLDFIHGEGYSAKQAKMKAEIAAELASDEREYAEWAKANPGEARKNAEERRWWRNKGYTYGSRGGASSSRSRNRDWSAYRAGREAGEGVGIDPQAEGSKQGRIGHG